MEKLKKNTSLSREYGQFISQFDWKYFMTCRYRYKLSEKINEILKIIDNHKEKIVFGNDQLESRD